MTGGNRVGIKEYIYSIKNVLPVDDFKKGFEEIEQYLDITAESINISLNKKRLKKPKKRPKIKVDNSWRLKTVSREIKFNLRKISRHI